jgi:putative transposase
MDTPTYREYEHAPSHLFLPNALYIVTAATYQKLRLFDTPAKRDFMVQKLFEEADRQEWRLEAWAVMANHYHFVARASSDPAALRAMIQALHSRSAIGLNAMNEEHRQRVWYQYWDSCITYERSYFARLNYVHTNPVKHGIVANAGDYPWCSMAWFLRNADENHRRSVLAACSDGISIRDDF